MEKEVILLRPVRIWISKTFEFCEIIIIGIGSKQPPCVFCVLCRWRGFVAVWRIHHVRKKKHVATFSFFFFILLLTNYYSLRFNNLV